MPNAYASKICAGKIKDPSGVKRKDFRGSKAKGGRIGYSEGTSEKGVRMGAKTFFVGKEDPRLRKGSFGTGKKDLGKRKKFKTIEQINQERTRGPVKVARESKAGVKMKEPISPTQKRDEDKAMKRESRLSTKIRGYNERVKRAGGGLMEATARLKRQGLGTGGSVCKIAKRGMNRDAIGKNS